MKSAFRWSALALLVSYSAAQAQSQPHYIDYPITVSGYQGKATDSVSYTGQTARYLLHDGLKSLAAEGNGEANPALLAKLQAYYGSSEAERVVLGHKWPEGFAAKQASIDALSSGKDLRSKTYQGAVTGWFGAPMAADLIDFWLEKAAASDKGVDVVNGYDYSQLISKTLIGAVFYNQAVDNYLDELLGAEVKPNDQPYSKGAAYTGKEHVWDEAFGYFGAPVHTLSLDPATVYDIAKKKPEALKAADLNKDQQIDFSREMTFANAYYAANADASGNTEYLRQIMQAFVDGRAIITNAAGKALSASERTALQAQADIIKTQWEQVLAEAVFKYAGSVYKDLAKLGAAVEGDEGDVSEIYRDYIKHWGELKGFSLALQMGAKNHGAIAAQINRLIGMGPVLLGGSQVVSVDAKGAYVQENTQSTQHYMINMISLQKLLMEQFSLKALANDRLSELSKLSGQLGDTLNAETD